MKFSFQIVQNKKDYPFLSDFVKVLGLNRHVIYLISHMIVIYLLGRCLFMCRKYTTRIRLDFDSKVTSHSKCYLKFASFNNLRSSSSVLLNPFIFIEWIIMHVNAMDQQKETSKVSYPVIAKAPQSLLFLVRTQTYNRPLSHSWTPNQPSHFGRGKSSTILLLQSD